MTNHIEQAKEILSDISHDELMGVVQGEIELAKANALIAIAEQLRIANLIGLNQEARVNSPVVRSLYQVDDSQFGSMVKGLQPDIAEALGFGGGSDD
ncbi:hypothetical protein [Bifidobacterium crudilactis]|jgi:hypothetical protein|uniref:hypothetical protein n=1 Tax=Bifidobacterium crudilactis TaxID=327277 RepID=UPI0023566242|nr:hypothetical protein [Bifidobacterium crudilactis]MCI1868505.1 hypothetical protein [Bifidobacterium crudilactis]